MAITLVVNPGSSSKKYALYQEGVLVLSAHVEHDEVGVTICLSVDGIADRCEALQAPSYETSLLDFIERAVASKVITSATLIDTVGIRVVAPGTYFTKDRVVDQEFMQKLKEAATKAPLHVPHTERELIMLRQALPHARIVAASDSAFHANRPEVARTYSIPAATATQFDLFRFGYHGLSVAAVVERLRERGELKEKLIVCHLGSGVSVTALQSGVSIDTTMGYAPGSGLIMGSRAGDLDTGALIALMQERHLRPIDADLYLQTEGGIKGMAGESDLRLILNRKATGDSAATRAIEHYIYMLQKAIGAYVAILGGLDALVFTATAGERSPVLRALVTDRLGGLGLKLNADKNNTLISREGEIQMSNSQAKILVIKTDEAKAIYQVTKQLCP